MHIFEDWPVVSIFEVCPYSALGLAGLYELFWGRDLDCAARDVGKKSSTEKD